MSFDFIDDALPTPDLSPEEERYLFERCLLDAAAAARRREDAAAAQADADRRSLAFALSTARDLVLRLGQAELVNDVHSHALRAILVVLKVCHPDEAPEIARALGKLKADYEDLTQDPKRAAIVARPFEELSRLMAVFEERPAPSPARPVVERLKLIQGGLAGLDAAPGEPPV